MRRIRGLVGIGVLILAVAGAAGVPTASAQLQGLSGMTGGDASESSGSGDAEGASESDGGGEGEEASETPGYAPGETPRSTVRAFLEATADHDYERAAGLLDLSRTRQSGPDLARQLEVVLDKKLWIDPKTVSNEPDGSPDDDLRPGRDRLGGVPLGEQEVPILLERIAADGKRVWRFAAVTVAAIPELYEAHGYGPLGRYLPDFFFDYRVLEIQLWQWGALFVLLVLAAVLSWLLSSVATTVLRAVLHRGRASTLERIVAVVTGPARLAIGVAIFSAGKHLLGLAIAVRSLLGAIEDFVFIVAITWATLRVVDVFADVVENELRERNQASAVTLLPPARKTIKAFAFVLAGLAILDSFGFNVTAVLAGLGVGGIAVALAAQKTLENLFGGITLYADRPVRVGDFCRFGDKLGTVEEIGIRSTRVRTLDRTLVTVPNAEFSNLHLENYTSRDRIWYHPRIGLRYETTPDQIRWILVEIRRMLYAHPRVNPDPARIRFVGFGAYSLDLDIFAYVEATDYGEYLEIAEDLNLRIMDIVERAGSSFAFPSQTTYIEEGDPLPRERQEQIGQDVEAWRKDRALYLPRFPDEKVSELRSTLDYPPKGSPFGPPPGDGTVDDG